MRFAKLMGIVLIGCVATHTYAATETFAIAGIGSAGLGSTPVDVWERPGFTTNVTTTDLGNGSTETDFGSLIVPGPNGLQFTTTGGAVTSGNAKLFVRFQPDQRIASSGSGGSIWIQADALQINGTALPNGGSSFPLDSITFTATDGSTYRFQTGSAFTVTVPEPASLTCFGSVAVGLLLHRRRSTE